MKGLSDVMLSAGASAAVLTALGIKRVSMMWTTALQALRSATRTVAVDPAAGSNVTMSPMSLICSGQQQHLKPFVTVRVSLIWCYHYIARAAVLRRRQALPLHACMPLRRNGFNLQDLVIHASTQLRQVQLGF